MEDTITTPVKATGKTTPREIIEAALEEAAHAASKDTPKAAWLTERVMLKADYRLINGKARSPYLLVPFLQTQSIFPSCKPPSKLSKLRELFPKTPDPDPSPAPCEFLTVTDRNPAWLQHRAENRARSRVYRLPSQILSRVLLHADPAMRQILRCTCSLFMRMVSESTIASTSARARADEAQPALQPLDKGDEAAEAADWWKAAAAVPDADLSANVLPGYPELSWPAADHERDLSARDYRQFTRALHSGSTSGTSRATPSLCQGCRDARESGRAADVVREFRDGAQLWCSACAAPHARILFSYPQRRKKDDARRVCIGVQGRVPICEHSYIHWTPRNESRPFRSKELHLACSRHLAPPAPHLSLPTYRRALYLQDPFIAEPAAPIGVAHRKAELVTSNLVRVFDLERGVPIAREHLARFLLDWTDGEGPGGTLREDNLCPHVRGREGRRKLLLPFEPGHCSCFDPAADASSTTDDGPSDRRAAVLATAAASAAAAESAARFHQHGPFSPLCCRCRTRTQPREARGGQFMPRDENLTRWYRDRRHTYACSQCPAIYHWMRGEGTEGHKVYLHIRRHAYFHTVAPSDAAWVRSMEPATWGLTEDEELRHVAWCSDASCGKTDTQRTLAVLLHAATKKSDNYI